MSGTVGFPLNLAQHIRPARNPPPGHSGRSSVIIVLTHTWVVIALLLVGCVSHQKLVSLAPVGRLIDIGGRRLHMLCVGSGSPTVILESGAAEGWYSWYLVQQQLGDGVRSCAYDRAGFGFSDPAPQPRTEAGLVEDLHKLLQRSGERGPYVLVGHSLGGILARRYAYRYPSEVAGLVLVDSAHEDFVRFGPPEIQEAGRRARARRAEEIRGWRATNTWPEMGAPDVLPPALRKIVLRLSASEKWWDARFAEGDLPDQNETVPAERRRLGIPLVVITAMNWPKPAIWPESAFAKWKEVRKELQGELVSRSPQSVHIEVDCGHSVQIERPDVVVDSIRKVIAAVQGGN